MATIEYWIQIENRPWDACPHNVDRMHGQTIEETLGSEGAKPVDVTLQSPETGVVQTRTMYLPVNLGTEVDGMGDTIWKVQDALILRRYTANWAQPDDRKVNPWDLNEPDPTDNGTMGTIPGPTIECNVGDKVVVHFRNKDFRIDKSVRQRTHSLHPHGIVFAPEYDGAYPLSPPDRTQPIPAGEAAAWSSIGVTSFRQGDRVPPDGTFTYTWDTFGWPATSGVWHYHDHSFCDAENVLLGALGFLVIHNPGDPDDVVTPDLPNGQPNGALSRRRCIQIPFPIRVLAEDVVNVRVGVHRKIGNQQELELNGGAMDSGTLARLQAIMDQSGLEPGRVMADKARGDKKKKQEIDAMLIDRGDFMVEIDPGVLVAHQICFNVYIDPPAQAQYLQYYHELPGAGMMINGRRFMGNTPTLIAGPSTKMRFGVAAMNNATFHTFHIHGHRWTVPGPDGTTAAAIQGSVQSTAVSQFEDTRILGPANSFSFTVNQGSFMGSRFTPDPDRAPGIGEWHMHCHVLNHMMPGGMMGSLKVIQGGEFFFGLPQGEPCHDEEEQPLDTVVVNGFAFTPSVLNAASGTSVTFDFQEADHTVTTTSVTGAAAGIEINNGGGPLDAIPAGQLRAVTITGNAGDEINYMCGIHGAGMSGKIQII